MTVFIQKRTVALPFGIEIRCAFPPLGLQAREIKMKHLYFVSYFYKKSDTAWGFGNGVLRVPKVKNIDSHQNLINELTNELGKKDIVILNFTKLN